MRRVPMSAQRSHAFDSKWKRNRPSQSSNQQSERGMTMTTEIAEYSNTEAALSDLGQRYKGVVFDVTTADGMSTAKKGRAEIRGYRTSLEDLRKAIKAPALRRCQVI